MPMKRRILGVVLGAAILATLVASGPAEARPAPKVKLSAREAAAVCGPNMTALSTKAGIACIHTAHDAMPKGHPHKSFAAAAPTQPKCYGNGINGSRVQLLYGYAKGQPNRAATILPKILNDWVPRIEGTFRNTSREQGRELGVRFYAPNCKLQVDVLEMPRPDPAQRPEAQLEAVYDFLHDEGYRDVDHKYLLWTDLTVRVGCGVGQTYLNDDPTPLNPNAYSMPPRSTGGQIAIVWGHCHGRGTTGALTETHELLHTLGAVQFSSPNSNKAGHCTDDLDIMCYTEQSIPTKRRCETPVHLLDCGMDDYFHAKPPVGSYLFTKWNTANSPFLGEAVGIDLLPVAHPRRSPDFP